MVREAVSGTRSFKGKPGMLQCMGPQRVGHDLTTEQQQQDQVTNEELVQNKPKEEAVVREAVSGTESFRHITTSKHLADYGCRIEYKCYEP